MAVLLNLDSLLENRKRNDSKFEIRPMKFFSKVSALAVPLQSSSRTRKDGISTLRYFLPELRCLRGQPSNRSGRSFPSLEFISLFSRVLPRVCDVDPSSYARLNLSSNLRSSVPKSLSPTPRRELFHFQGLKSLPSFAVNLTRS